MTIRRVVTLLFLLLTTSLSAATFTVTNSYYTGPGSLTEAILSANATPGLDQIRFAVGFVQVDGSFPSFTDPVDIDGTIGPGRVVLTQSSAYPHLIFAVGSSGSTVRRVEIDAGFPALTVNAEVTGVIITSIRITGTVVINGDDNVVGGLAATDRNVISRVNVSGTGNQLINSEVLQVSVGFAVNTRIGDTGLGNRIGNVRVFESPGTIIESNVVWAQQINVPAIGVFQTSPLAAPIIENNSVETAVTGISVDAPATRVLDNTIFGVTTGIVVASPRTEVRITGNSIHDAGIAIDLGADGSTPNDPAPDADTGANNLQNFPILTSATLGDGSLVVNGTLASVPLTTYLIEIFSDTAASADARTLLASFNVTTDAAGLASFSHTVTTPLPAADEVVAATATNELTNDTSEVSAPIAVDAPGTLAFDPATYTVNEGEGTVLITVTRSGGTEGTVTVQFATQPETAIAPPDYTTTGGTLTFGPGVTTQTFSIPITSDAVPEPEESFSVTLSGATGGATIGTGTATVVIASHLPAEAIPTASTWGLLAMAAMLSAAALLALTRMN